MEKKNLLQKPIHPPAEAPSVGGFLGLRIITSYQECVKQPC
jgi:hypothetical protein